MKIIIIVNPIYSLTLCKYTFFYKNKPYKNIRL